MASAVELLVQAPPRQPQPLAGIVLGQSLEQVLVGFLDRAEGTLNLLLRELDHADLLGERVGRAVARDHPLEELAIGQEQVSLVVGLLRAARRRPVGTGSSAPAPIPTVRPSEAARSNPFVSNRRL